ncbi:MAG: NAD(P)-binding domain-containing protein [Caulobacteraceae bacterium]
MQGGHQTVVYDRSDKAVADLVKDGAVGAKDLADLVRQMTPPRAVWVMLPAGAPTEETVTALGELLQPGDTVIDGGNTFYKDDVRRAAALKDKGLTYVDVGTSGGVWGLERGYCMMVGGDKEAVDRIDPILKTLAPGPGDHPAHQTARRRPTRAPSTATSTPGRWGRGTSSRWCTTASSTA